MKRGLKEGGKFAITVSGWLVAFFLGVLDMPQKVHSFFETFPVAKKDVATWWNLDTDFTGSWTNEGSVTATGDVMPVAIRMRVYGGKVDGEIWSDGLSNMIHPVILLGGELRRGELDAYAYDFEEGKEVIYAVFKVAKKGEHLVLKTQEQQTPFFPPEAELFSSPDALKDKPLTNFDLILKTLRSQKNN